MLRSVLSVWSVVIWIVKVGLLFFLFFVDLVMLLIDCLIGILLGFLCFLGLSFIELLLILGIFIELENERCFFEVEFFKLKSVFCIIVGVKVDVIFDF